MRSKYGTMLAAAVCVAALGLVVVASASAESGLPEFQQSGKTLAKTVKFSGGSIRETLFKTKNGAVWACETNALSGETKGSNGMGNIVIKFTGCRVGEKPCTSKGAKEDELITTALSGRIGYLSKTKKEVGLLLEPSSGTIIAECGGGLVLKMRGSIIGKIIPTNTETTKFEVVYRSGLELGEDEWTHFEGEEVLHELESKVLGGAEFSRTSVAVTTELVTAEKLEIKA